LKINKVTLENIRSYVHQEIIFPEGSLLLWGNIGSGKSTILLAIDFAFFGLQRGNLTGASLLRNGATTGTVEMSFEVDGKEYIIKRTLKRGKSSVTQDAGYIINAGIKKEKTAVELKQAILDILNYPKDLLTKNKSLIYRYTVYTPQEEIKNILLGSKEERLDTLRKVFGVDKYKRVRDNAKTVTMRLKELKKLFEGATIDLTDKIMEKEFKEKEKIELEKKLFILQPEVEQLQTLVTKKKEELEDFEKKKEELSRINKQIELCHLDLKHKIEQKDQDIAKLALLKEEIAELEKEQLDLPEGILENIKSIELQIQEKEKHVREVLNQVSELRARKNHSLMIKQKIESLNNCPTCLQEVSLGHKNTIVNKCVTENQEHDEKINLHETKQRDIDQEVTLLREKLEGLRKKEGHVHVIKLKMQQLQRKKSDFAELLKKSQGVKGQIGEINARVMEIQTNKEQLQIREEVYPELKRKLDEIREQYNNKNLEKNRIEATLQPIVSLLLNLSQEISKKQEMRAKQERVNNTLFWITSYFMPLMGTMEQNILLKVHSEFNTLFEKWFSILIDNHTLRMTLDEDYTPRIWQNGYDIEYEFLSGGEKTAGALAYRLALNQVINNLNTGLKTRDLLILDEPTDGFSHEQLDRLRILMDEINIPQIVIVSHEPQIESFVDSIIKLEKTNHQTIVI